jgi:hypothetical protein
MRALRGALPVLLTAATVIMTTERQALPLFTTQFNLEPHDTFVPHGGNRYFSLEPGHFQVLEGEDDNMPVQVVITVLPKTQLVTFQVGGHWMRAEARVVEEREWIDGELAQVSLNYFALCARTENVYMFGEEVDHYENGKVIDHEGSWMAGVDGAQPGLMMPGTFLLGARYHQEIAREAMDRAENVAMGVVVETKAGVFRNCVVVQETTPLEPDEEVLKVYAPGIGLIVDDGLEIVEYGND